MNTVFTELLPMLEETEEVSKEGINSNTNKKKITFVYEGFFFAPIFLVLILRSNSLDLKIIIIFSFSSLLLVLNSMFGENLFIRN